MSYDEVLPAQDTDWRAVAHGIDGELDRLHRAVAEARRQDWRGRDVVEPELENFLARLTQPAPAPGRAPVTSHAAAGERHHGWSDLIHRVG